MATTTNIRTESFGNRKIRTVQESVNGEELDSTVVVLYGTKSDGSLDAVKTDGSGKIQVVFA